MTVPSAAMSIQAGCAGIRSLAQEMPVPSHRSLTLEIL